MNSSVDEMRTFLCKNKPPHTHSDHVDDDCETVKLLLIFVPFAISVHSFSLASSHHDYTELQWTISMQHREVRTMMKSEKLNPFDLWLSSSVAHLFRPPLTHPIHTSHNAWNSTIYITFFTSHFFDDVYLHLHPNEMKIVHKQHSSTSHSTEWCSKQHSTSARISKRRTHISTASERHRILLISLLMLAVSAGAAGSALKFCNSSRWAVKSWNGFWKFEMKIDLIFSVNHTENSINHLSPFISEVANNTRILPSAGMCSSRVETFLSDIYEENKKFKKRAHDQRSESSAREYHSNAAPRILAHILKWTRIKFLGSLDVVFIYWPFSKNYESAVQKHSS